MNRHLFILWMVLTCACAASAQEIGGEESQPLVTESFDEIYLTDGNVLRGNLIEEQAELVIFETVSLGRLEIPLANIRRIARRGQGAGEISDPDYNSIMFCPTAATLPKGDGYFRNFELFILNFGFGVTDALDISFATLFPVSSSALMLSGGAKLRLLDREKFPIGLALTGSYTQLEESHFGAFGGVAGIGNARRSLNLAVNRTFDDDGDAQTAFIIGGDIQGGSRSKIFAEYFNSATLLFDDTDDDLEGFINIGFRVFGERHSFSLSGFRPLVDDSGGFIAFPMVMYSHHF